MKKTISYRFLFWAGWKKLKDESKLKARDGKKGKKGRKEKNLKDQYRYLRMNLMFSMSLTGRSKSLNVYSLPRLNFAHFTPTE